MQSHKQKLRAGTVIGERYIIEKPLGQGGMAQVYLAMDQKEKAYVAVKVMNDDLAEDPEFIKRFDTEARAASSLDHPNIVKIIDYGQDGELRYIVQEYVEGMTLIDLIRKEGPLDWKAAVPLFIQIGLALEHAHRRGVIHRDIKPHNILITRDMIAKVTDFGIARAVNANTITLTSGVTFGSVHYFSPEQARGSMVSEKSDIYSLGILMHEVLTSRLPFDGDTSVAVAIKHLQEMPPPASSINPGLPKALDNIINKCVQKSPAKRYRDARDLVDELDAFMVEPEGVYGLVDEQSDDHGSTTAIGLKRPDPNYRKLREIESAINARRRARRRDLLIVISIILLSLVFLTSIGVWGWQRIREGLQTQPDRTFEIGNYVGQEVRDVTPLLDDAEIRYVVQYREDETVAEGIVIDQNPSPGIVIRPGGGTVLYLYVSGGRDMITIPDYTGETQTLARTELEQNYGFKVNVTYEYSEFDKDRVIKTIPAAGQRAPRGSEITLVVSDGLPKVIMPDIAGKPYLEAKDELVALNLVLGPATSMSVDLETGEPVDVPEAERIVIRQHPQAGEEIMAQTVVSLIYGTAFDYQHYLNPTPTPEPSPTPEPTPEETPEPTPEPTTAPTTAPTTTAPTTESTTAPTTTAPTTTAPTESEPDETGKPPGNPGQNP